MVHLDFKSQYPPVNALLGKSVDAVLLRAFEDAEEVDLDRGAIFGKGQFEGRMGLGTGMAPWSRVWLWAAMVERRRMRLAVLMVVAEWTVSEGDLAAAGSIGMEAAAFLEYRLSWYFYKCLIRWQLRAKSLTNV